MWRLWIASWTHDEGQPLLWNLQPWSSLGQSVDVLEAWFLESQGLFSHLCLVDCDARRSFGGNGRWEEWLVLCEVELPWALRPGEIGRKKGRRSVG